MLLQRVSRIRNFGWKPEGSAPPPPATPAPPERWHHLFWSRDPLVLRRRDPALRPMPVLLGLLVYFALTALLALLTVERMTGNWQDDLETGLSVLSAQNGAPPQKVIDWLVQQPMIKSAEILEDRTVRESLKPWVGGSEAVKEIPIPQVISIRLQPGQAVDLAVFQQQLRNLDPALRLVDNRLWLDDARKVTGVVGNLALGGFVLVLAGLGLVVFAVTRIVFSLNHQDITILHLAGATDRYISRQFERVMLRLAGLGVVLAGGLVFLTVVMARNGVSTLEQSGMLGGLAFGWPEWLVVILVPVLLLAGALRLSRITVERSLQGMGV